MIAKSLPLQNNYFRNAPLRAPNAPQTCFAYEQFVDELAYAAGMDPYQFRLQNIATNASDQANGLVSLTWDRWKNVLMGAAKQANWQPRVANSVKQTGSTCVPAAASRSGSFANTMVGNVAEVSVNMKSGKISVTKVFSSQDTGMTVYPDGLVEPGHRQPDHGYQPGHARAGGVQPEAGDEPRLGHLPDPSVQGRAEDRLPVHPALRHPGDEHRDTLANGTTTPSSTVAASGVFVSGSGEPPLSSIGAAIANAFFDATGVRIRSAPMSPERVRQALKAAGQGLGRRHRRLSERARQRARFR